MNISSIAKSEGSEDEYLVEFMGFGLPEEYSIYAFGALGFLLCMCCFCVYMCCFFRRQRVERRKSRDFNNFFQEFQSTPNEHREKPIVLPPAPNPAQSVHRRRSSRGLSQLVSGSFRRQSSRLEGLVWEEKLAIEASSLEDSEEFDIYGSFQQVREPGISVDDVSEWPERAPKVNLFTQENQKREAGLSVTSDGEDPNPANLPPSPRIPPAPTPRTARRSQIMNRNSITHSRTRSETKRRRSLFATPVPKELPKAPTTPKKSTQGEPSFRFNNNALGEQPGMGQGTYYENDSVLAGGANFSESEDELEPPSPLFHNQADEIPDGHIGTYYENDKILLDDGHHESSHSADLDDDLSQEELVSFPNMPDLVTGDGAKEFLDAIRRQPESSAPSYKRSPVLSSNLDPSEPSSYKRGGQLRIDLSEDMGGKRIEDDEDLEEVKRGAHSAKRDASTRFEYNMSDEYRPSSHKRDVSLAKPPPNLPPPLLSQSQKREPVSLSFDKRRAETSYLDVDDDLRE